MATQRKFRVEYRYRAEDSDTYEERDYGIVTASNEGDACDMVAQREVPTGKWPGKDPNGLTSDQARGWLRYHLTATRIEEHDNEKVS